MLAGEFRSHFEISDSHNHYGFAKDASLSIFDFWGFPYGL